MRTFVLRGVVLAVLALAVGANAAAAATAPALVAGGVNTPLSNATNLSGADAVAVSGNYAYEVSYWSGQLNVIDITNPLVPTIVASTPSTVAMTAATNVTVANGFAFVTAKNRNASPTSNDDLSGNSLTIVDVSTPTAPVVKGTLQDPTNLFGAYSVAVSGNYAYVASQGLLTGQPTTPDTSTGSFTVLNISTGTPTFVASIANPASGSNFNALAHATGVAIKGSYAFVTAFNGSRLTTIDISNPATPFIAHTLDDPIGLLKANDVVINGNYAYVADQTGGGSFQLAVVNISSPTAPSIVSTLSDSHLLGAYRIRAHGSFVYLSASNVASVSAVDVSTPTAPRVAGSATANASLANVTGLDVSSSGRYIIATSPHLSTESSAVFPPYPLQTGGPTATGTVSIIDLDPTPIAVSIASEPTNPTTQTTAAFSVAASDQVATFQCSLDGAGFVPCSTAPTYSGLSVGSHTFTVQAMDATGAPSALVSYTWTVSTPPPPPPPPPVTKTAPRNTTAPKITGTAQQGSTLSASTGTWSGTPAPTFSYQWQRCNAHGNSCTSIANQTGSTYKATVADVGSKLDVVVTAKNSVASKAVSASATGVVSWSSGKFASSTLSHSKTTKLGFTLSVPSPGGGVLLQKLVISLPKGLSFKGSHGAFAKKLVLKSLAHKKLAFKVTVKHGVLTITLTKASTGVSLTLPRGFIRKAKSAKLTSAKLKLSLSYAGTPVRSGSFAPHLG